MIIAACYFQVTDRIALHLAEDTAHVIVEYADVETFGCKGDIQLVTGRVLVIERAFDPGLVFIARDAGVHRHQPGTRIHVSFHGHVADLFIIHPHFFRYRVVLNDLFPEGVLEFYFAGDDAFEPWLVHEERGEIIDVHFSQFGHQVDAVAFVIGLGIDHNFLFTLREANVFGFDIGFA